ncbi:MAG TPA: PfkB family carbohydrate kinase [Pseudonocardia sp.]|jgi:1-phosphofructokinase|nr:PfkB family carbohydrate kinase [Pseudonocardia sp.]
MPDAPAVVVFAPSPLLTVTVEDRSGEADIHVHAGGQGVWEARMIVSLGVPVVVCAALGGETGRLLAHLLHGEGMTLVDVAADVRNGGYVHDRRRSERSVVAEAPGGALGRHDLDALYEATLAHGLRHGTVLLSGPQDDRVIPASIYRRLAVDLAANECTVAVDLAGERLTEALHGEPDLVKVSHSELVDDGRAADAELPSLLTAMRSLRADGAGTVVVSRAAEPAVALVEDTVYEIRMPSLEPAEPRGAGDSMTAGMVAARAEGRSWTDALRLGAACGALNVVRHGLGTGGRDAVSVLAERIELAELE